MLFRNLDLYLLNLYELFYLLIILIRYFFFMFYCSLLILFLNLIYFFIGFDLIDWMMGFFSKQCHLPNLIFQFFHLDTLKFLIHVFDHFWTLRYKLLRWTIYRFLDHFCYLHNNFLNIRHSCFLKISKDHNHVFFLI